VWFYLHLRVEQQRCFQHIQESLPLQFISNLSSKSSIRFKERIQLLNHNIFKDTLFIVDEASMISNQAMEQSVFGSGNLLRDW